MSFQKDLENSKTPEECITTYECIVHEVNEHRAGGKTPPGGFSPYWNSALDALKKALELADQCLETKEDRMLVFRRVYSLASQQEERTNFVKLAKKAKKKYDETFASL